MSISSLIQRNPEHFSDANLKKLFRARIARQKIDHAHKIFYSNAALTQIPQSATSFGAFLPEEARHDFQHFLSNFHENLNAHLKASILDTKKDDLRLRDIHLPFLEFLMHYFNEFDGLSSSLDQRDESGLNFRLTLSISRDMIQKSNALADLISKPYWSDFFMREHPAFATEIRNAFVSGSRLSGEFLSSTLSPENTDCVDFRNSDVLGSPNAIKTVTENDVTFAIDYSVLDKPLSDYFAHMNGSGSADYSNESIEARMIGLDHFISEKLFNHDTKLLSRFIEFAPIARLVTLAYPNIREATVQEVENFQRTEIEAHTLAFIETLRAWMDAHIHPTVSLTERNGQELSSRITGDEFLVIPNDATFLPTDLPVYLVEREGDAPDDWYFLPMSPSFDPVTVDGYGNTRVTKLSEATGTTIVCHHFFEAQFSPEIFVHAMEFGLQMLEASGLEPELVARYRAATLVPYADIAELDPPLYLETLNAEDDEEIVETGTSTFVAPEPDHADDDEGDEDYSDDEEEDDEEEDDDDYEDDDDDDHDDDESHDNIHVFDSIESFLRQHPQVEPEQPVTATDDAPTHIIHMTATEGQALSSFHLMVDGVHHTFHTLGDARNAVRDLKQLAVTGGVISENAMLMVHRIVCTQEEFNALPVFSVRNYEPIII